MLSSADFNGVLLEKFYSEYVAFKFHLRADAAHLFVLHDVWICRPNIFGNGSMCGMFFKGRATYRFSFAMRHNDANKINPPTPSHTPCHF